MAFFAPFIGIAGIASTIAGGALSAANTALTIYSVVPNRDTAPAIDPLTKGNSIVRLGIGLLPEEHAQNLTNVDYTDFGGALPTLRAFNENRQLIGSSADDTGKINSGAWASIEIVQNGTGLAQQATYLEIRGAVDDPICVAYIAHTWSDGITVGWLGDMGEWCKRPSYYSNLFVPTSNGSIYKPRCTWFGGDGTGNFQMIQSGMRIHTTDFGRLTSGGNEYTLPNDPQSLCNSPSTEWYQRPATVASAARKRPSLFDITQVLFSVLSTLATSVSATFTGERGNNSWQNTLIASKHPEHSAVELCSNLNMWGPDLVSFEEHAFCDMSTRKTYPLCNATVAKNCYDWDLHALVSSRIRKREMKYARVEMWK